MRDMFPEYYFNPDKKQLKKLWKKAIFVPDTNVLLDIFRFSPETSNDLIRILKHLKEKNRLWIPHQFAYEYLKRLPSIRVTIRKKHREQTNEFDNLCQLFGNLLRRFDGQTDYELGEQIAKVEGIFKTIKKGLNEQRQKHKERLDSEDLESQIEKIFNGRIGGAFSDDRLGEVYLEGEWRYKLRRPPGFKDEGKPESSRYGDLIGWMQIIEHAAGAESKRPVILITRDTNGDDWFYKPGLDGQTRGPRPELVKEMRDKAAVDFYIHETWEFIKLANKYLTLAAPVLETTIEEARRPRQASVTYDPLASLAGIDSTVQHMVSDKQMRQTLRDLYAPVNVSEIVRQATKDLYAPADVSEMMRQATKDLYAPVNVSEIMQQTLKDLHTPVDVSEIMRQTLKDLHKPVDVSEIMRQSLKDVSQRTNFRGQTRQTRPSLQDIARNAREAAISSEDPVDTADRSREILSDEYDEPTHSDDE